MVRYYLLFIVVAGVLGSMLSSGGSRSSSNRSEAIESRSDRHEEAMSRDSEASDSSDLSNAVELERERDGHFYADVEINGTPIRALVDTGASGIALSRDDARRAGVGVSIGMPEVVGEGASGAVRGERIVLDRVALGPKSAEDVGAVVLDTGDMTLLGQSFLSEFDSVEIQGDKMILR